MSIVTVKATIKHSLIHIPIFVAAKAHRMNVEDFVSTSLTLANLIKDSSTEEFSEAERKAAQGASKVLNGVVGELDVGSDDLNILLKLSIDRNPILVRGKQDTFVLVGDASLPLHLALPSMYTLHRGELIHNTNYVEELLPLDNALDLIYTEGFYHVPDTGVVRRVGRNLQYYQCCNNYHTDNGMESHPVTYRGRTVHLIDLMPKYVKERDLYLDIKVEYVNVELLDFPKVVEITTFGRNLMKAKTSKLTVTTKGVSDQFNAGEATITVEEGKGSAVLSVRFNLIDPIESWTEIVRSHIEPYILSKTGNKYYDYDVDTGTKSINTIDERLIELIPSLSHIICNDPVPVDRIVRFLNDFAGLDIDENTDSFGKLKQIVDAVKG